MGLRKRSPGLTVKLWEKTDKPGGRYNTSSPQLIAPTSTITSSLKPHVDLGAQYVTAFEPGAHGHYYQAFLTGAAVEFERQLRCLNVVDGAGWLLTDESGNEERADVVVLTCPIPDILRIQGIPHDALMPYKDDLEKVSYSSRFAMGVYYSVDAWAALKSVAWSGKYFTPADSDVIVWISINGLDHMGGAPRAAAQAELEHSEGPSVLVHTTVPYGMKNGEADRDEVKATIMKHLNNLLPELADVTPLETQLHYWSISQVYKGYQHDQEKRPAVLPVSETPLLLLAGDAFTKSGFDGCIDSAEAACAIIMQTAEGISTSSTNGVEQQAAKAAM